jgi:hypothetical protein
VNELGSKMREINPEHLLENQIASEENSKVFAMKGSPVLTRPRV